MSGISTGSIFFTPAVIMLSMMNAAENIVKSTAKCVFAGAIAVHNYNKKQEEKKLNKLSKETDKLNEAVMKSLFEQSGRFDESIESMADSISQTHKELSARIEGSTAEEFKKLLLESEKNMLSQINKLHSSFQKNYNETINRSNAFISSSLTKLRENIFGEINSIETNAEMKNELAKQRAEELLDNAKVLAASLEMNAADKYILEAQSDIAKGNFQSAISLSSSAITELYMNLYKSDASEKERAFYESSCIFLIAEMKEFLNNIKEVDFKPSAESEKTMTADLTVFMDGKYEKFVSEIEKTEKLISSESELMSANELMTITQKLGSLYTEVNEAVMDAFYLMTYSLNRTEVEKAIYRILKEKGFKLTDTLYTDGDPSKAGERKYSCSLTGEELSVSIIPYTDEENEIKTEIVLHSNESSEESREQYRKDIINTLKSGCPNIDSINLSCKEETRNKNAHDTGEETVIPNPQHIRTVQR